MEYLYRIITLTLITIVVSLSTFAYGQDTTNLVSGKFQQARFSDFIASVETQTSYHFYFEASRFDSLDVTLNVQNQPLPVVLDSVFAGTVFRYAIDDNNRVFLTADKEIRTELPIDFFGAQSGRESVVDATMYDFMYSSEQKKSLTAEERLYEIGPRSSRIRTARATLTGYVRNNITGEPVAGAAVYNETSKTGAVTDPFGYYSMTVPTGRSKLKITFVGMHEAKRNIMVYADGKLDVELKEYVTSLREVVVEADGASNISRTQMGLEKLDIKTMKQVPVAFGETDVLKVILTLPGVQSVGESSTGLNVRGGATDQNLTLFDDATIFNTAHLFGFFSAFNPDVVKEVELYKSGIPAEYGGRLSSILKVTSREGNKKKFGGSGGIGLITGRLTLEGPIKQGKSSFLIGGRSTYSDWLLKKIPNDNLKHSAGSFYDLNLHLNHEIDQKNAVDFTAYYSSDRFRLDNDTTYHYNNITGSLMWRHTFHEKLYSDFGLSYSYYGYDVASDKNPVNAMELKYNIGQIKARGDLSYLLNDRNTVNFGASVIRYNLLPGSLKPTGSESLLVADEIQKEQALESALYVGDKFDVNPNLSLYAGLRYSFYNYLGAHDVYQYTAGLPREENTIIDTVHYGSGKFIRTYQGPEYRLSMRYKLSDNASVKLSYQRMRQYIHMLSNTTAISPTDIWKLSDPHIRPQLGDQISLGYYRNFKGNLIETSVEAYYKTMKDFLDYKGGAVLTMNHHIETDVLSTKGRAYGVEVMLKKVAGKLNGWVSYTYSRSLLQTKATETSESVNNGKEYPSNFDKPHNVTVISNYRFSRRFSVSLNFTYNTGRPITVPIAKYNLDGSMRLLYSDRNQYRIPDYYRADFAMNFEGNHKIKKLAHSSWSVSVYNLTGRRNAYSVFFRSEDGVVKGYKMSIFGSPIPTITYNFKF